MRQLVGWLQQSLFEDKPDWFGARLQIFLLEHPNIGLALIYLFATGIGLLFEFLLFLQFGVNILDYAETSDFVWSAVKRPQPAIGSLLAVLFLIGSRALAKSALHLSWWPLRLFLIAFTWPGLLRREILTVLLIPILLAMYSGGARFKAHDKTYFEDTIITVTTRSEDAKIVEMIPIGSVGDFFFGIHYSNGLKEARSSQSTVSTDVIATAVHNSNIQKIEYTRVPIKKIPQRDETLKKWENLFRVPLR